MAFHAITYLFKGVKTRARSKTGSVTLDDAAARAAREHLAAQHLRIVDDRVVPNPHAPALATWVDFLVPARADVDLQRVDAILRDRLASVARDLACVITATSGYRSTARQAQLYAAYKAGRGPRAAKPGTSNHERGLAVDCWVGGTPLGRVHGAVAVLKQHGLVEGATGESWHMEMVETGSGWRGPDRG